MKYLKISLLALAIFCQPVFAENGLVIITAKDNTETLSIDNVARIFLGKVTKYPSGEKVIPLNMDPMDPSYEEFARVVLKKSVSQVRAYWAKKTFTGKGVPPRVISTTKELKKLVAEDKKYLSYIDKNNIDHTVRWAIELN